MGWDNGVLLHQDMINMLAWKIGTWGAETKALTCAIDVGLSLESATSEGPLLVYYLPYLMYLLVLSTVIFYTYL